MLTAKAFLQVVGNKLFMFGGYGGNGRLDDFYEFSFGRTSHVVFSSIMKYSLTSVLLETKTWREVEYTGTSPGVRENNVSGKALLKYTVPP